VASDETLRCLSLGNKSVSIIFRNSKAESEIV
jgi:hypothetical protein